MDKTNSQNPFVETQICPWFFFHIRFFILVNGKSKSQIVYNGFQFSWMSTHCVTILSNCQIQWNEKNCLVLNNALHLWGIKKSTDGDAKFTNIESETFSIDFLFTFFRFTHRSLLLHFTSFFVVLFAIRVTGNF